MAENAPVVYLLYGDDDFAQSQFITARQEKMGDPTNAEMNITYLAGNDLTIGSLTNSAKAIPFLSSRRMVVAENVSQRFSSQDEQAKFITLLETLPTSTALVLLEERNLEGKGNKTGRWMLEWAKGEGDRCFIRKFSIPKGGQLVRWIQEYAKGCAGEVDTRAAQRLAEVNAEEPRAAASEVDKLLAYVNYSRPVAIEDVEEAAFGQERGDYFTLIDATMAGNGRSAMDMLQRLMDEQEPLSLFFSLVGHFRLLLQVREMYENGSLVETVTRELNLHPFRAKKLHNQAKTFSMADLEHIYHRLLDYDQQIKTGQLEADLALEMLVVGLTS